MEAKLDCRSAGILGSTNILYVVRGNIVNHLFWGYQNWPSVCLAIAVFVGFKYINWEQMSRYDKIKGIIPKLAGMSFGVYLIHIFVLREYQSILNISSSSLKCRVLGPFIIYGISIIIVGIFQKIPILRKIIP